MEEVIKAVINADDAEFLTNFGASSLQKILELPTKIDTPEERLMEEYD